LLNTFESLRFVIESGGKRSGVGDECINASSLCRTYRKFVREMSAKIEKSVLRNVLRANSGWCSVAVAKS
jgi:ribosomal protein L18E